MKNFEWTEEEISKCITVEEESNGKPKCWILYYSKYDNDTPDREHAGEYSCTKTVHGIYSSKKAALEKYREQKLYERVRDDLVFFNKQIINVDYFLYEGGLEDELDEEVEQEFIERLSSMDELEAAEEVVKMFSISRLKDNYGAWDDPFYDYQYELSPFYGDFEISGDDCNSWDSEIVIP